ncbi:MAG: energy-coupling factor transporter transmembrane protein EcfT, partial [Mycobacterium sp.]|nr:energy-coupling factor transporter transmembrane protein EcfT [Mycobacterium sp.]
MSDTRVRRPVVLLRPVPGTSVIHELWAGTKIVVVFCVSVVLAFYPGWVPIALMAALLAVTARLAHISRGVLPSVPRWLWILLLLGAVTATLGGGAPV